MRSRTLLRAAAGILAASAASAAATAELERTATFVGCYDTSSSMFKAATFRAEHIKSLDDCLVSLAQCHTISAKGEVARPGFGRQQ